MTGAVEAAGGAVVRLDEGGAVEVALVHRPRHGDWTLPKGKLDPSESFEEAALREVEEETGFACRLGPEVGRTEYEDDSGLQKVVRYWLMTPLSGEFQASGEVDELRWVSREEAAELLTYDPDRELLASLDTDVVAALLG